MKFMNLGNDLRSEMLPEDLISDQHALETYRRNTFIMEIARVLSQLQVMQAQGIPDHENILDAPLGTKWELFSKDHKSKFTIVKNDIYHIDFKEAPVVIH